MQIHGPDGPTDPDQRWCATLDGSGFIPFTSFNTECWSGSGQPYAGEPLATAMVLVPGEAASPVPYDFCLDGLVEAGAPAVLVPSAEGNLSVDAGYVVAGDWQGYAWTARDSNGSIVEPSDLSTVSGTALCAAGSVAPSENWDGWAMLGVELNQADDGSTPGTIVPTAAGLLVCIDNVAGSELRVQIQGPNGATEPNERWCAALTGSGVVPWNQFNTECWSGTGSTYAGEPLENAAILVPGNDITAVPFGFCLTDLGQGEGVTVPTADGALSVVNGYVTAGSWHGYAWTAAASNGSSVEPGDFSDFSGTALCTAGSVAPSENWDGWAMLGIELNQADDGSAPASVVPTSQGLLVDVDNVGGSLLRIQIHGADAATDPNARWCAALTGSGVVPWNQFNTECWSGEGIAYAGEPLESVAIMAPGDNIAPVDYAFCLKNAAEQGTAKPGHGPKPRPPLGHHGNNSSAGGSGGCRTWPALPRWSGGHSAWSHRGPSWLRPMRHAWR